MNVLLKRKKLAPNELDSFYDSRILIHLSDAKLGSRIENVFRHEGFSKITISLECDRFADLIAHKKHDLIIVDLSCKPDTAHGYAQLEMIRHNDADTAIITLSDFDPDMHKLLEVNVGNNFRKPFLLANLVKAAKRAIGDKNNYEIGMQFFDALFGMQMCTHRDLHQRTFDHVIRTTKIYGKFLLFLSKNGHLELTSWALKNCLMASLVHDIGKLLVMHGILYKEGKLSDFEYQQIRRHPWHSVTALLGGQDIDFFAKHGGPIETVSGYNQKNLGAQVQQWIFKVMRGDTSAFDDIEHYFTDMSEFPFVHSLNKDLLYIVFRHHDGVNQSYHAPEEIEAFGRIIGRDVTQELDPESQIDMATNALSLCDMFDALLDTRRDYRKTSYSSVFALFLLYSEMRSGKFFPLLTEQFVKFLVENERMELQNPFYTLRDGAKAYRAIENVYELFRITKNQESDFNDFLKLNENEFETYAINEDNEGLIALNAKWVDYFTRSHRERVDEFMNELKKEGLIGTDRAIDNMTLDEIKVFDMLLGFYYSFSSPSKQRKIVQYLVHSVTDTSLSADARDRIAAIAADPAVKTRKEFESRILAAGYGRHDLFRVFAGFDENTLVNEMNEFIRRTGY